MPRRPVRRPAAATREQVLEAAIRGSLQGRRLGIRRDIDGLRAVLGARLRPPG